MLHLLHLAMAKATEFWMPACARREEELAIVNHCGITLGFSAVSFLKAALTRQPWDANEVQNVGHS